MDDKELLELAAHLNEKNMSFEAHSCMSTDLKPEGMLRLAGNRAALIRIAATCLEVAALSIPEERVESAARIPAKKPGKRYYDHEQGDSYFTLTKISRRELWNAEAQ